MKRISATLCLLLLAACAQQCTAGDIVKDSDNKKSGSTRAKGSYRVFQDGSNVKIKIDFSVKKTGISGTGKGVMTFEILDDNFEPAFKIQKGFTVGADLSGAAKKEFGKTITATGAKAEKILNEGIYAGFTVQVEKDSMGIPTNVGEWKDALADWATVADKLPSWDGGAEDKPLSANGWRFKRLKH